MEIIIVTTEAGTRAEFRLWSPLGLIIITGRFLCLCLQNVVFLNNYKYVCTFLYKIMFCKGPLIRSVCAACYKKGTSKKIWHQWRGCHVVATSTQACDDADFPVFQLPEY